MKQIAASSDLDIYVRQAGDNYRPEVVIHEREYLNREARFALNLIEKWGMVQAFNDGEDTAGRSKLGLMPVTDVVSRAFELSKLAHTHAKEHGLSVALPSLIDPPDTEDKSPSRRGKWFP